MPTRYPTCLMVSTLVSNEQNPRKSNMAKELEKYPFDFFSILLFIIYISRKVLMYNPISNDFFDQLTVAMERKIPSTIEYYQNEEQEKKQEKQQIKVLVKTMEVIGGFEFLVLDTNEKIRLSLVVKFNGKRHRED